MGLGIQERYNCRLQPSGSSHFVVGVLLEWNTVPWSYLKRLQLPADTSVILQDDCRRTDKACWAEITGMPELAEHVLSAVAEHLNRPETGSIE